MMKNDKKLIDEIEPAVRSYGIKSREVNKILWREAEKREKKGRIQFVGLTSLLLTGLPTYQYFYPRLQNDPTLYGAGCFLLEITLVAGCLGTCIYLGGEMIEGDYTRWDYYTELKNIIREHFE